MSDVKKAVLAYSGGVDTSIILKWLQNTYDCEVVTFTADLGQGEEVEEARAKTEACGVSSIYIEDLREDFVRDYIFPMFRANAIYEGYDLEDPWCEPSESMWRWSASPEQAPDKAEYIELAYTGGDITAVNGKTMTPAQVLAELNRLGGKHGIGRLDIVENRFVGMKSRGCYETPVASSN